MRQIEIDLTTRTDHQARALAEAGAPAPFCVRAARVERFTIADMSAPSPDGALAFTLAWPTRREGKRYVGASIVAASAIAEHLEQACETAEAPVQPMLSVAWPDTVCVASGIVASVSLRRLILPDRSPEQRNLLLITCTALVNTPEDNARALGPSARSLSAVAEASLDIEGIAEQIPASLEQLLARFDEEGLSEPRRRAITQRLLWLGERVEIKGRDDDKPAVVGILRAIDDYGGTIIETASGKVACRSGVLRPMPR